MQQSLTGLSTWHAWSNLNLTAGSLLIDVPYFSKVQNLSEPKVCWFLGALPIILQDTFEIPQPDTFITSLDLFFPHFISPSLDPKSN